MSVRLPFVALLIAGLIMGRASAQTIEFDTIPSVDEVIGVLSPGDVSGTVAVQGTSRTIRDPATNADLTVPQLLPAGAPVPAALPARPAAPSANPAPPPRRPVRPAVIAQTAHFATGKADLPNPVRRMLDVIAAAMLKIPTLGLVVSGHTDAAGRLEVNEPLSQLRADAARQYLIARGIAPDRIVAIGQGARMPLPGLAANDPANRRLQYWPRPRPG